jgi:hypothetical protein
VSAKEIIFIPETGLGDHFLANALVNIVCRYVDKVFLPTYCNNVHNNLSSVKALYCENPKVEVVPVPWFLYHWTPGLSWQDYFNSWNTPILQLQKPPQTSPYWYTYFYEQFQLNWSVHRTHAYVPYTKGAHQLLAEVVTTHGKNYRVVHSVSSHGRYDFKSCGDTTLPTVEIVPGITESLLDWVLVLENAREVHACQSSVFWLCNILKNCDATLYYHNSRPSNHFIYPVHFPRWIFVNGYF